MAQLRLSILDLAFVGEGESVRDAFAGSVALAQLAERRGYERVWYAEHHNMRSIASSATAVLIGHVADRTNSIRLGAGGIMLPNHSPLVIAEQFGTLAELHPGRIDLGLGRAPGSDQATWRALRRDPAAADRFPHDVLELQGYLSDESVVEGISAIPGRGTHVPLYVLGSSLFGAQLAALLGLPFAFASHFAPQALEEALRRYREGFRPSAQLEEPYAIAGHNVIAADTEAAAQEQLEHTRRARVRSLFQRPDGQRLTDGQVREILCSPRGMAVDEMMRYTAAGTPDAVVDQLERFRKETEVDEIITVHPGATVDQRLRSIELLADAALP